MMCSGQVLHEPSITHSISLLQSVCWGLPGRASLAANKESEPRYEPQTVTALNVGNTRFSDWLMSATL